MVEARRGSVCGERARGGLMTRSRWRRCDTVRSLCACLYPAAAELCQLLSRWEGLLETSDRRPSAVPCGPDARPSAGARNVAVGGDVIQMRP
jgi:hypothetical protein